MELENNVNNEVELTAVDRTIARVTGLICGAGAGILVGAVAFGAANSMSGVGKVLKKLMNFGAFGLETVAVFKVYDTTEEWALNMITGVKKIGKAINAVANKKETVEPNTEELAMTAAE